MPNVFLDHLDVQTLGDQRAQLAKKKPLRLSFTVLGKPRRDVILIELIQRIDILPKLGKFDHAQQKIGFKIVLQ
jgi:hypothetical protein